MTALVRQVQEKQRKLAQLLDQAWKIEEELNALHKALAPGPRITSRFAMRPRPNKRIHPLGPVVDGGLIQKVRVALLTGPFAKVNDRHPLAVLCGRCEDIPGATTSVIEEVLDGLVSAGVVAKADNLYARVA